MDKGETQKLVRDAYGKIAQGREGCACDTAGADPRTFATSIGYSDDELRAAPGEANLGLSCGNPIALAGLKEGEVVLRWIPPKRKSYIAFKHVTPSLALTPAFINEVERAFSTASPLMRFIAKALEMSY